MNTLERALHAGVPARRSPGAATRLLRMLPQLQRGALELVTPEGATHRFGPGGAAIEGRSSASAVLALHRWKALGAAVRGGDVGFAQAYIEGDWDTPDLVQLLAVLAANQRSLEDAFYGRAWVRGMLRLRHWLRANSRRQAKRNIAAHYDLGNDFYALWLDRTMTYSSALFDGDLTRTLEDAQHAKNARILGELALAPASRVLEIGCGWGGFAEAAARAGHRVTGVSLSQAQTSYARDRVERAGLAERTDLRLQDYRDVDERFDGVASIEMFEAVGERWWPAYFRAVHDALRPGGRACIQAITIADARFERYRTQSDFIQQYIFPGGMLASPEVMIDTARAAGLAIERTRTFGGDYAETLTRWLAAFEANADAVRARFDERFVRCWRFYLAYCIAGFATGTTDVGQYTFRRA